MSTEQPVATTSTVPPSTIYSSNSLYVGDLRSDVGESDIYDAFKDCGAILSVRVCRDVKDQHSLGYAYVNFQSPENAQKALDTLNGHSLKGKPCRIMWSCRDPSQRKSSEGNLYVKYLDKSVTLVDLNDVFSHFGTVSSSKVQTKDDGSSLCYGFVQFAKVEDSVKALEASKTDRDQFKRLGEKFTCEKFIPKHLRASNANNTYTNLYVKNIGAKFTTDDLKKMFEVFGEITSPVIMSDDAGNSRRFGFVNFKDHEAAVKAQEAMDKKPYKWKDDALVGPVEEGEDVEQLKKDGYTVLNLYVARAQKKPEHEATVKYERNLHGTTPAAKTNVYIRNLADSVTDADLRALLTPFGDIKSCIVMRYPNGSSKGFGFCDFATSDSATQAIQKTMNQLFQGKPLYLALAQKKGDRRAMLESQHSQQRFFPVMGSVYRQPMYPPPFFNFPPGMYPAYTQRMYRQPQYTRNFQHRQTQNRRPASKPQPQPAQQQQPIQPVQPAQPVAPSPEAEKQRIGETIYSRMMPMFPGDQNLWGKLTGMLLESIDLAVLRSLISDEAALTEKINQAKDYYDKHMQEGAAN